MDIDTRELTVLAHDLVNASDEVVGEARKVIERGALNIKQDLQQQASGHPSFPHFPRSITYDSEVTPGGIEAEIGPDKDRMQGALGNILYFGTSRHGPVLPEPMGALEREAGNVERFLADVMAGIL